MKVMGIGLLTVTLLEFERSGSFLSWYERKTENMAFKKIVGSLNRGWGLQILADHILAIVLQGRSVSSLGMM